MAETSIQFATCAHKVIQAFEARLVELHPQQSVNIILYREAFESKSDINDTIKQISNISTKNTKDRGKPESNSESSPDKIREILTDCIPCLGRLSSEFELTMNSDITNQIKTDLVGKINSFNQLSYLFSSHKADLMSRICQLIRWSNKNCLPDLRLLKLMLGLMLLDLKGSISDLLSADFSVFIRSFFSPFTHIFAQQLDKLMQLLIGPVKCIEASLTTELAKIEDLNPRVVAAGIRGIHSGSNRTVGELRRAELELESTLSGGIGLVTKWTSYSTDWMTRKFQYAVKKLEELVHFKIHNSNKRLELAQAIQEIMFVISVLELFEKFRKERSEFCKENENNPSTVVEKFLGAKKGELRELNINIETQNNSSIVLPNPAIKPLTIKDLDSGLVADLKTSEIETVKSLLNNIEAVAEPKPVELSCLESKYLDSTNLNAWLERIRSY